MHAVALDHAGDLREVEMHSRIRHAHRSTRDEREVSLDDAWIKSHWRERERVHDAREYGRLLQGQQIVRDAFMTNERKLGRS